MCNDWKSHPIDSSIDVSVLRFHILDACDHLIFSDALSLDIERIKEADIGLGDEVFIAGLFKHHHGDSKNIPIIRIGNLAAMGEEKVETTEYGKIDAFLIEARSIGGLSGSPVFVNLGIARAIKGKVKFAESGRPIFYFLGLIHGHYDVSYSDVDLDVEGQNQINTGIAIVVPFSKINNVIEEIEKIER